MLVAVRMCPPPGTTTEHPAVTYLLAWRPSITRVPFGARSPLRHWQEAARTLIPGVHNLPQGRHLRSGEGTEEQQACNCYNASTGPGGHYLIGLYLTLHQLLNNLP